ncbi:MAG: DUF4261 domain-containing protein [Vicinamibacteria bacterium]|nr:DUF4261 domain-containing protein [Vicinamibacteria bacterium]
MTLLAFVTLGRNGGPVDAQRLATSLRERWRLKVDMREGEQQGDPGVLVFDLMGSMATVSHMPGPIPWSDLAGPAAAAWHWKEATEVLEAHKSHLLVGLLRDDGLPPLKRAIMLTLLTASVIECASDCTGVYWGSGTAVTPAERFARSAQLMTPEELPLFSWIEFRVFQGEEPETWCVFTTGMKALGHLEIEVRDSRVGASELVDRVYGIAHYLTQAGPVLKDGDTVGDSDEERIRVRHTPSAWDREGPVLRLEV